MKLFVSVDAVARALGAEAVVAALVAEAEARGVAIEITPVGSRGMTWLEPLVEVEVDGVRQAYGPMAPGDVAALFDGTLAGHGPTEEIGFFAGQTRVTFARCGRIHPLSLEAYGAEGGLAGLRKALADPAGIVGVVTESGLRGRGGAGFPTGIKWKTVAEAKAERKYIVCNADEGDS
ncbi:MAG: formate dehydrogenase, partial [Maritimibacter sp.]|nr:formate dehydrogenase [Maritimibacter sp.]